MNSSKEDNIKERVCGEMESIGEIEGLGLEIDVVNDGIDVGGVGNDDGEEVVSNKQCVEGGDGLVEEE
jgi:hypothetical protein